MRHPGFVFHKMSYHCIMPSNFFIDYKMQMILSCQRIVSSGIKILRKPKSLMFEPFPIPVGIDQNIAFHASPATSNSAKLIFAHQVCSAHFFSSSTLSSQSASSIKLWSVSQCKPYRAECHFVATVLPSILMGLKGTVVLFSALAHLPCLISSETVSKIFQTHNFHQVLCVPTLVYIYRLTGP